jgi:hypothetical protein
VYGPAGKSTVNVNDVGDEGAKKREHLSGDEVGGLEQSGMLFLFTST